MPAEVVTDSAPEPTPAEVITDAPPEEFDEAESVEVSTAAPPKPVESHAKRLIHFSKKMGYDPLKTKIPTQNILHFPTCSPIFLI